MFGVGVDGFDSREEISRVSFHEDGVLAEVDVLVVGFEVGFEERVVFGERVEDETETRRRKKRSQLGISKRAEEDEGKIYEARMDGMKLTFLP